MADYGTIIRGCERGYSEWVLSEIVFRFVGIVKVERWKVDEAAGGQALVGFYHVYDSSNFIS